MSPSPANIPATLCHFLQDVLTRVLLKPQGTFGSQEASTMTVLPWLDCAFRTISFCPFTKAD
jgi:hypothetical protein